MTLLGLDVNAGRIRGVCGPARAPRPIALHDGQRDLPLAISLEKRRLEVGRAGVALCRRLPHFACTEFLPHLGEARQWRAGRHRLDASGALAAVLPCLQPACVGVKGLALTLPSYLSRSQAGLIAGLCVKARLPLLGSVSASLANAWTTHERQPWRGLALVLDADEYALTWSAAIAEAAAPGQLRVLVDKPIHLLGIRKWKERLIDGIAERLIRQSRRDLRDSADAEQILFDHLDDTFDACAAGEDIELAVQSAHWYQTLLVPPAESARCCAPLVRQAIDALPGLLQAASVDTAPAVLLVSATAARLPGLMAALHQHFSAGTALIALSPDTAARAAHELAERWQAGALPPGHADTALPLRRVAPETTPSRTTTDRVGRTKLPARGVPLPCPPADDDFSVTIDE